MDEQQQQQNKQQQQPLTDLVNVLTTRKVRQSTVFLEKCAHHSLLEVVEQVIDATSSSSSSTLSSSSSGAVGCIYGPAKLPSLFLCLLHRFHELRPSHDILQEIILQEEHKYLRVFGILYARLTWARSSAAAAVLLTLVVHDLRRVKVQSADGSFCLTTVDQVCAEILDRDNVVFCGVPLHRLKTN